MTEPLTEAGKRLDLAWPGLHLARLEWQRHILAIEAEAQRDTEPLREAARSLVDALPYEPGSMLGGKIALVIAVLGEEPDGR